MKSIRELVAGPVTVIWADLDAHGGMDRLLSADELDRAERFRGAQCKARYIASRGVLRMLLSQRLGADPATLPIVEQKPFGKPTLRGRVPIHFNLAHSGPQALFAFSSAGEVGVDIEHVRELDPVALSRTCFSQNEQQQLQMVPRSDRLEAFFDGWVRKEAVMKADGRGVALGLDSFSVSLRGQARLLQAPLGQEESRWSLCSIDAGPAVRAAFAIRS